MDVIIDNEKMKIMRLELSSFATNAYIIICHKTGKSALIDAPAGAPTLLKNLKDTSLECIFLTHSHIDHIGGLKATRERLSAALAVHTADNQKWLPVPPDLLLSDGDIVHIGQINIKAIYTPGHTPGSMCFQIENYLFSGDTLFPGGPGRTVGPDEFRQAVRSITEKIFPLPDETKVYPGHGDSTVLGKEKGEYAIFASRPHDANLCGDVVWRTS
jgi:glyoxylase-like metal-dependent hydrolase (beta-lactamase superfamily II)